MKLNRRRITQNTVEISVIFKFKLMLIIANITGIIYTLKHILRTIIENPKTEISFEMKSSEMKYHFQPAIKALTIFSH